MKSNKLDKLELVDLHGEEYVKNFEKNKILKEKRLIGILKNINLSQTLNVVDYGCGNGQLFDLIGNQINSYTGVDFSPSFINSFKKKLEGQKNKLNPALFCQDITDFVKEHNKIFDLAFTLDFSEHIYDKDFISIYSSIYRSLKNGGKLILHTPNGNFFLEWMRNNGILRQRDEHIAVRNAKQYLPLLKEVGFQEINVKHIPHYNLLKYLYPLTSIPLIGKIFESRILITCIK